MGKNYYLHKDIHTGEIVYLEYDKINGYPITPKTKIEDAINVNKIIFVEPSLRKKMLKKKVDIKIKLLLKKLDDISENGASSGDIKRSIMDAERLRINIINHYVKYFGNTYGSYSVKKLQIIINQLKMKLAQKSIQDRMLAYFNDYSYEEDEKKGRGR